MRSLIDRLRQWAKALKRQILLLWLCCRHPDMPRLPKLIGLSIVLYAISPIDLIPDFIPVLGLLDDVLLLPLGIALAIRLTPPALLVECARQADELRDKRIESKARWWVAALIVAIWIAAAKLLWTLNFPT